VDAKSLFRRIVRADFADVLGVALRGDVVSVAHVRKRLNAVRVVELASQRLEGPAEAHGAEATSFLREFVANTGVEAGRVAIAVDRSVTLMASMQIPASAAGNAATVAGYELDRLIPVPPDSLFWGHLVRPVGTVGERVAVTIVSAPRVAVEEAAAVVTNAGLPVSAVTAEPLALADYTGFAGLPLAAVFTRSGTRDYITLCADGLLVSSHHLDPRARSRTEAVAREVEATLPEYSDRAPACLSARPASDAEASLTSVAPPDFFPVGATVGEAEIVAVGAALSQLSESRAPLNLLPATLVQTAAGVGLREMALSGAVVVMALVLMATIAAKNLAIDNALAAEVETLEPMAEQVLRQQDKNLEMLARVEKLESKSRSNVTRYLKEITDLVPQDAYLTTFRYKENRIELDGIAARASDLIAILEASASFANVNFTAPTTKYLANQERFSLRMDLEE